MRPDRGRLRPRWAAAIWAAAILLSASTMMAGPSSAASGITSAQDRAGRTAPLATRRTPARPAASRHTLLVAGDIASCSWSADSATARLIETRGGLVMTAGDNVYQLGSHQQFRSCYGPTWGRFRDQTRPVPGNHDCATPAAAGYFRYFGRRAGPPGRGYYAFDLGEWRIHALDSDCGVGGRCPKGSSQYRWLAADLARHPRRCSMAVMHHPHFSSGQHGNINLTRPLVGLLYRGGVEILVTGHDHTYERFAPARPWGRADPEHGIRQFIVGTGGAPLYGFRDGRPSHSRVRQNTTHGVLRLYLLPEAYARRFLAARGPAFEDTGGGDCHGPPSVNAGVAVVGSSAVR